MRPRSKVPGRRKRVMVVVGEASGDLHGASLVKALWQRDPTLEVFGVAGDGLRRTGMRVLVDVAHLAGMGLVELIGNLGNVWRAYRILKKALREEKPSLLILIDFPEFNLRLARAAKRIAVPVLYYISPQVWAWRRRRVRKIARRIDHMAVVLPFEAPLYADEGIGVSFVGHPLLDIARPHCDRASTLAQLGLEVSRPTIALLPGSRRREVAYHLPVMLDAADLLRKESDVQFLMVRASTVDRELLKEIAGARSFQIPVLEGNTYDALDACDLAWTASGTATLEAALMLKPMVIIYRLSWLTYGLARLLVSVKHIGLVNIVAGERVVPELIQSEVNAERLVGETRAILRDPDRRRKIIEKLAEVRGKLGSPGAAVRVAELALDMMA